MKSLKLITDDGFSIAATLFEPEVSSQKFLLINSATGVRQQVYYAFARYFAEQGFTVLTYDYRGVGLSKPDTLKGFKANMRQWGTLDFKAATTFMQKHYAQYSCFAIGHSVGGLIMGMNPDAVQFRRLVFFGAQKAYAAHLNFKIMMLGFMGFGVLQPVLSGLAGYFPAHWFGLGESLPAGAGRDWRTLIVHPQSTNQLLHKLPEHYAALLTQDVLVIRAEDDSWLTAKAVRKMMEETFPRMKPEYRLLKPEDSPQNQIGHINFFRSFNQNLWQQVLDYFS